MPATDLPTLAARLDRPVDSFPALDKLTPPQMGRLCSAVERSCTRHDEAIDNSIPWVLRTLLTGRRRRA